MSRLEGMFRRHKRELDRDYEETDMTEEEYELKMDTLEAELEDAYEAEREGRDD